MTDWTHSFVQRASITKPFDAYPCPPPLRLITTVIRLNYTVGEAGAPVARLSGSNVEDIIPTTAGKAFIHLLEATGTEPGRDRTMWSAPMEETDCLLVFIGWAEGILRSAPFTSTGTFRQLPPASKLSAFNAWLRSPAEVTHIPFPHFNGAPVKEAGAVSFEMVTWEIPADLDPTYHKGPAATFDHLGWGLAMMVAHPPISHPTSHSAIVEPGSHIHNRWSRALENLVRRRIFSCLHGRAKARKRR